MRLHSYRGIHYLPLTMKQGLTYQLTERKGAADGHSEAVPLSGAFNHIDILEFVSQNHQQCSGSNQDTPYH